LNEEKLKEAISKVKDAEDWLNHPVFKHVLSLREAELFSAFKSSKFDESEKREEIWRKSQAFATMKSDLERIIKNARKANEKLEELNSK